MRTLIAGEPTVLWHMRLRQVERKPTFTVVFNGVTVQDSVEIDGSTLNRKATLSPHPVKQPIKLQYHNDPIEFRNIWIQDLGE